MLLNFRKIETTGRIILDDAKLQGFPKQTAYHFTSLLSSVLCLAASMEKPPYSDSVCDWVRRLDNFVSNECKAWSSFLHLYISTYSDPFSPNAYTQYTQTRVPAWPQAWLCPFRSQEYSATLK